MNQSKSSKPQLNRRSFLQTAGFLAGAPMLAAGANLPLPTENLGDIREPPVDLSEHLHTAGPHLCLAGTWSFRLDPKNQGIAERWFEQQLNGEPIFLPGSTDQAGYGERVKEAAAGHLSRPFTYTGPAWYDCSFVMPQDWLGTRVSLYLERCHWQTTAWLDGQSLGSQDSLSVPHEYELGTKLAAGPHRLTICVDNTLKIDLGATAHAVTEQTQGNWNGIVGTVELRSVPQVCIEHVRIVSDIHRRVATFEIALRNVSDNPASGRLIASVQGIDGRSTLDVADYRGNTKVRLELTLPEPLHLWDEYQPSPYIAELRLDAVSGPETYSHSMAMPLAMREMATRGTQFTLNRRPIFLRGTVENAIFPLTAYPPMDIDPWRRIFRIAASYGMNHLRFHSYCPPEAAFLAADEAGFLLHVELPVFSHHVASTPGLLEFMREEGTRILRTYGNHPSFTMLCMGNELKDGWELMDSLVAEFKQMDNRRLYTYSTNNGRDAPGGSSDYWVTEETRQGRLRLDKTRFNAHDDGTLYAFSKAIAGFHVPVVAHELGQWAVDPSYDEISEYTGVLKPRNLEVFRAQLEQRGMGDLAVVFQQASGRFSAQIYKEDIESALRTAQFGGFQLLQLSDYPGQQEALVGMLDSFWESKGIITPEQFHRFCGSTVPLCRFAKFAWTNEETFEAEVEVAHYAVKPIRQAPVRWSVMDDEGRVLHTGNLGSCMARSGELVPLGKILLPLNSCKQAARWTIEVQIHGVAANSWRIWVYPKQIPLSEPGVTVTSSFPEAATRLERGEKVILCLPPAAAGASLLKLRFLPVFWSFGIFKKQPGVMGVLCDPLHRALADFPTEMHSDWQWWSLTEGTQAFILDDLPPELSPIVQVIDDFHRNHKLGMVLEASSSRGKLLLTSLPLAESLQDEPVRRQLLASLLKYAGSQSWSPSTVIPIEKIRDLINA